MLEKTSPGGKLNIALSDSNYFFRNAIYALLEELGTQVKISVSIKYYPLLADALKQGDIDLVFWSGPEFGVGYGCLKYIKEARQQYPKMVICMYSRQSEVPSWVSEHISNYLSLSEPLSAWRNYIMEVINARVTQKNTKPNIL